jgi:hypothetical protein
MSNRNRRQTRVPFRSAKGPSLRVAWYLQYNDRSEVKESERNTLDLLPEIERKVIAGDFQTRSQPFDPRNDHGNDCTVTYEDILEDTRKSGKILTRTIPPVMVEAIQ